MQSDQTIVETANLLAVVLIDDSLDIGNDSIDQVAFQGFFRGERPAFGYSGLRQLHIAPALGCVAPDVGGCVADNLLLHYVFDLTAR